MLNTGFTVDSYYFSKLHELVICYRDDMRLYCVVEMKIIECLKNIYTFRCLDLAMYQAVIRSYQIAYIGFNLEAVRLRPLA